MVEFDPKNWYWIVNGSATEVYSSATGGYVSALDQTYAAWLQSGNDPSRIRSEAELGEVLAVYQVRPVTVTVLDSYQDTHARRITLEIVAKLLLWLVNEVRTLKGQPTITAAQFRAFVKGLM